MKALPRITPKIGAVLSSLCQRCGNPFEYFYKGGYRKNCDACNTELARQQKRRENHRRDKNTPAGRASRKRRVQRWKKRNAGQLNKSRWRQKQRDVLGSGYIKDQIKNQTGLPFADVDAEIIEEKKKQLTALRLYRRARKEIVL